MYDSKRYNKFQPRTIRETVRSGKVELSGRFNTDFVRAHSVYSLSDNNPDGRNVFIYVFNRWQSHFVQLMRYLFFWD